MGGKGGQMPPQLFFLAPQFAPPSFRLNFSPMAEILFNPKPLHPHLLCALNNQLNFIHIISWHHQKTQIQFPLPAMLIKCGFTLSRYKTARAIVHRVRR